MDELEQAEETRDVAAAEIAQKKVDTLTEQMDESNPVLTAISDAMTAEGNARSQAQHATSSTDVAKAHAAAEEWKLKKVAGQQQLQSISDRYKKRMADLRQQATN